MQDEPEQKISFKEVSNKLANLVDGYGAYWIVGLLLLLAVCPIFFSNFAIHNDLWLVQFGGEPVSHLTHGVFSQPEAASLLVFIAIKCDFIRILIFAS